MVEKKTLDHTKIKEILKIKIKIKILNEFKKQLKFLKQFFF